MDKELLFHDIPYRICIGVTGHRHLEQPDALARRIRTVLASQILSLFYSRSQNLIKSFGHLRLRFTVLTPLAEGADRVVAHEVLTTPDAMVEVVLPLEKGEYTKDFTSRESRQEFEAMLSRARRIIPPPQPSLPPVNREIAYLNAGKYVVDNCDVLIALWDSRPASGGGGTAEIVEYARSKSRPLIIISTTAPYEITVEPGSGLNVDSISGIEARNAGSVSPGKALGGMD